MRRSVPLKDPLLEEEGEEEVFPVSMKPLAPRTLDAYQKVLKLAFGGKEIRLANLKTHWVLDWGDSYKNQLKCALAWHFASQGKRAPRELFAAIPRKYHVQTTPYIPSEKDVQKIEDATERLKPVERASVLLLLYLGLRAEEFCGLPREAVEEAVQTGRLTFLRKGGRTHTLDVEAVMPLLVTLLKTPKRQRSIQNEAEEWTTVGESLCTTKNKVSHYHALRRLVLKAAELAGLDKVSPHKLRHAFATRMSRDGANVFTIKSALNHKNLTTTQLYIHPGTDDIAVFMRGPKSKQ